MTFWTYIFPKGMLSISDAAGRLIGTASKTANNLYRLDEVITQRKDVKGHSSEAAMVSAAEADDLWHQRLGHLGEDNMKRLHSHRMVEGLLLSSKPHLKFCEACVVGKQTRTAFRKSGVRRATELLELVHTDLNGAQSVASFGGALYFMLVIDDLSRYTSIYFLKQKSDALKCFDVFRQYAERKTGRLLKNVRSDQGGRVHFKCLSAIL